MIYFRIDFILFFAIQFLKIFNGSENLMSKASNYRPTVHIKLNFFRKKKSVNYKIKKITSSLWIFYFVIPFDIFL